MSSAIIGASEEPPDVSSPLRPPKERRDADGATDGSLPSPSASSSSGGSGSHDKTHDAHGSVFLDKGVTISGAKKGKGLTDSETDKRRRLERGNSSILS